MSHFLSLPIELREQIYCKLFPQTTYKIEIQGEMFDMQSPPPRSPTSSATGRLAILRVCRQVYEEAHSMLYHCSKLLVYIHGHPSDKDVTTSFRPLESWQGFQHMRHVKLIAVRGYEILYNILEFSAATKTNDQMQNSDLKIRFSDDHREDIWRISTTLSTLCSSCKVKVWLVPGVKIEEAEAWLKDMLEKIDGVDCSEEYEKEAAIWHRGGRAISAYDHMEQRDFGVGAAEI